MLKLIISYKIKTGLFQSSSKHLICYFQNNCYGAKILVNDTFPVDHPPVICSGSMIFNTVVKFLDNIDTLSYQIKLVSHQYTLNYTTNFTKLEVIDLVTDILNGIIDDFNCISAKYGKFHNLSVNIPLECQY